MKVTYGDIVKASKGAFGELIEKKEIPTKVSLKIVTLIDELSGKLGIFNTMKNQLIEKIGIPDGKTGKPMIYQGTPEMAAFNIELAEVMNTEVDISLNEKIAVKVGTISPASIMALRPFIDIEVYA